LEVEALKTTRLISRRASSRIVLFSFRGKAAIGRAASAEAGRKTNMGTNVGTNMGTSTGTNMGTSIGTNMGISTGVNTGPNTGVNQQKIIDFATLASWYAENNAANDTGDDRNMARTYTDKQRNLRFLTL